MGIRVEGGARYGKRIKRYKLLGLKQDTRGFPGDSVVENLPAGQEIPAPG